MATEFCIIVEGKNDRRRLRQVVPTTIPIGMTHGLPGTDRLEALAKLAGRRQVIIFTDADSTGRRIRRMLMEVFPEAINLYTKPRFQGVEHTPLSYIEGRLRRVGVLDALPDEA